MTSTPWALVPIKDTSRAKERLSSLLSRRERQTLAVTMAEDLLAALVRVPELGGIAVVTEDSALAESARALGARVISDGAGDGHSGAVRAGIRALLADGHETVLTLPADIPLTGPDELSQLIAAHVAAHGTGPGFTIVPAHDRRGSNAILCTPPDVVPLSFGNDSFLPHLATAGAAGLTPRIVTLPGVGLDIDNPADLMAFLQVPSDSLTRRLLLDWGMAATETLVVSEGGRR